jgi:hypothetical protein
MERRFALLLTAIAAISVACTAPIPNPSPTAVQTAIPTPRPTVVGPSPTLTPRLAHFQSGRASFDYPETWQVLVQDWLDHPVLTIAAVGTGEWAEPCLTPPPSPGQVCSNNPVSYVRLDSSEFAVTVTQQIGGPPIIPYDTPPFNSELLPSGLASTVHETNLGLEARIYVPGSIALGVDAQFRRPLDPSFIEDARRLIESMSAPGANAPVTLTTWRPRGGSGCTQDSRSGRLARGSFDGLVLSGEDDFGGFLWPAGWTTRLADDMRVELLDENGSVMAREWDAVEVGGRGAVGRFRVCPDSVRVVRPFPTL